MSEWQPIESAPRAGEIILWLGETWPDHADVRAGSYVSGDQAEEMGYREYAKYGAWMIVHSGGEDWFLIDVSEPRGWIALPALTTAMEGEKA